MKYNPIINHSLCFGRKKLKIFVLRYFPNELKIDQKEFFLLENVSFEGKQSPKNIMNQGIQIQFSCNVFAK